VGIESAELEGLGHGDFARRSYSAITSAKRF